MAIGIVKWWNDNQGYGCITLTGGGENGKDVFVHHTTIQTEGYPTLEEGQTVEFELTRGRSGLIANNVRERGSAIQTPQVWQNSAPVQIKIFNERSTRRAEYEINLWAEDTGNRIINASITNNIEEEHVTVIVVYSTE